MLAAVLEAPGKPLAVRELEDPVAGPGQLLLNVRACGVCRTDLHLRDGEIEASRLPVVLGHQIVGVTDDGRRVGVPWLGWTDGSVATAPAAARTCARGRGSPVATSTAGSRS